MKHTYFRYLVATILIGLISPAWATHYRAGEITYKQISLLQYRITVITYTDQTKDADKFTGTISIDYGDGVTDVISRTNGDGKIMHDAITQFPVKQNIYETVHVYRGAATYKISVTDPNRVAGIVNAPGQSTDKFAFYVETQLVISNSLGYNQSPVLSVPPIDMGCLNQIYTHNPGAHDPDGDSLYYELRSPNIALNVPMPGFILPYASSFIHLDSVHGQLTWDRPQVAGIYNIVIRIYEFRHGRPIGYVDRDMQIFISSFCNNRPPTITQLPDACILEGQTYSRILTASDPDAGNKVSVLGYGGPFIQTVSPAVLNPPIPSGNVPLNFQFQWKPACSSIRYRPFQANFKVEDNASSPLTTLGYLSLKVIAPPLPNFTITAKSNGFILNWSPDSCKRAIYYEIYRRVDSSNWNPSSCETGVPAYTGFVLLDTLNGYNRSSYIDTDHGRGLSPMIRYCYRVVAVYPPQSENGNYIYGEISESIASSEICNMLVRTAPVCIQNSIRTTDAIHGSVQIRWIKPSQLDTNQYPAPYRYVLKRQDAQGVFSVPVVQLDYPTYTALNDTGWVDSLVNTTSSTVQYIIELWTSPNGVLQKTESSVPAGSVFLQLYNTDRTIRLSWKEQVPWINTSYTIYRQLPGNAVFDSIATVTGHAFIDYPLVNGKTYCYRVLSQGGYNKSAYPNTIYNFSQIACGAPIDTVPPCSPPFTVIPPCDAFESNPEVIIRWVYPANCGSDLKEFKIYHQNNALDSLQWIGTAAANATEYHDTRSSLKYSIAGCYVLTAIDTNGNESNRFNAVCIDNCPEYILPNVFTPGENDSLNTVFKPFPYRFVDKVEMTIYNRWGQIVFETQNPDISWNGKDMNTGKELSEGVYFYICDVYERYLSGVKKRNLRGTITLIRP